MSREGFLRRLEQSKREEEKYNQLYRSYEKEFREEFVRVIAYYHNVPRQVVIIQKREVSILLKRYERKMWESYNINYSSNANKEKVRLFGSLIKPMSKEDFDVRWLNSRKEYKSMLQEEYDEAWHRQVFWESALMSIVDTNFKYYIYSLLKKVFTKYYIDDILEFDSDYLRRFDEDIQHIAFQFVDDIYELEFVKE